MTPSSHFQFWSLASGLMNRDNTQLKIFIQHNRKAYIRGFQLTVRGIFKPARQTDAGQKNKIMW